MLNTFPSSIGNGTKTPAIAISIQHSSEGSRQCNKVRKTCLSIHIGKEKIKKLVIFHSGIVYVENPQDLQIIYWD